MSDGPKITDLSKQVASYLTTEFGQFYTARHNSNVIYPLESLAEIRVDVWPGSLQRTRVTRAGFSKILSLYIAIQGRAETQEREDALVNLTDDTLNHLLGQRYLSSSVYCSGGEFVNGDISDRLAKYEENVFQAILTVNFQWIK